MKRKRDAIHDQTPLKRQRLSSDMDDSLEFKDPFSFEISSSECFESSTAVAISVLDVPIEFTFAPLVSAEVDWPIFPYFDSTMDLVGIVRVPEAVQKLPDEGKFEFCGLQPNSEQFPVGSPIYTPWCVSLTFCLLQPTHTIQISDPTH